MAGGFVGVDLFLASGRLLGSCALSVRCGPGNTGQDTIGFEIEIEILVMRAAVMRRRAHRLGRVVVQQLVVSSDHPHQVCSCQHSLSDLSKL